MALCDVFHFTVHSCRLLCSSSLRQGASEPETVVEIFVHVGRVCAVLCPHHTRPKQLCSVSMPYIDASIELCNVTCCFICCAAKDSCVQRVSQHLLDQELGVTTLSTAKMNSTFKKPWILLDLPCRNKECARWLRLQSFIVDLSYLQLNPKTCEGLNQQTSLRPAGGNGISSPEGKLGNDTVLQRVCWLRTRPMLPLLVTIPKYF